MATHGLRLHLDGSEFSPGDRIRGEVEVIDPGRWRGVSVELRELERSGTDAGRTHTKSRVLQSRNLADGAALEPGTRLPFELPLDADVVRGFRTNRVSRVLSVAAKADRLGSDVVDEQPLTVAPAQPTAVAVAVRKRHGAEYVSATKNSELLVGLVLVGVGIVAVILGLAMTDDPSTRAAEDASRALFIGFGVFATCGGGAIAWVKSSRWRPGALGSVEVGVPDRALQPGSTMTATIVNPSGEPLDVGLCTTQRWNVPQNQVHGHPPLEHTGLLRADWQRVEPGQHDVVFELPDDLPPSYARDLLGIDHTVRVMRAGDSTSRRLRPHVEARVIVT